MTLFYIYISSCSFIPAYVELLRIILMSDCMSALDSIIVSASDLHSLNYPFLILHMWLCISLWNPLFHSTSGSRWNLWTKLVIRLIVHFVSGFNSVLKQSCKSSVYECSQNWYFTSTSCVSDCRFPDRSPPPRLFLARLHLAHCNWHSSWAT